VNDYIKTRAKVKPAIGFDVAARRFQWVVTEFADKYISAKMAIIMV